MKADAAPRLVSSNNFNVAMLRLLPLLQLNADLSPFSMQPVAMWRIWYPAVCIPDSLCVYQETVPSLISIKDD